MNNPIGISYSGKYPIYNFASVFNGQRQGWPSLLKLKSSSESLYVLCMYLKFKLKHLNRGPLTFGHRIESEHNLKSEQRKL